YLHGLDVLPIRRDDRHREPRYAHVEDRHRRAVDEAQAHALARRERARPVAGRRHAVHEIGIAVPADVGEIARLHAHTGPRETVAQRAAEAVAAAVADEVAERAAVVVEIARVALQQP